MADSAVLRGEESWLSDLAAEFLDGQASFDFPALGEEQDPFASDGLLLPSLTFPSSSDDSTPAQQGSPAQPPISAGQPPSQGGLEAFGRTLLPQAPAHQPTEPDHGRFPPFGYVPPQLAAPQEPPSLSKSSIGDASVSSGDRWTGYDASGSSGHLRGSGSGSGGVSGGQPPPELQASYSDDYDKANNQVLKFKEKNRAAQRRYRERQKEKLLASEEKVAELQQQLQRMRLEQETLAQRNALLERLLAMQQQAQAQAPTETGKRAAIEGQKDAWWLDKQMKVYMEQAMQLSGELVFTVRKAAPLRLTQAQLAAMPHKDFGDLWREYMNAFAECLLEMNGDENSPAGRRLTRLVFEAGQLKGAILMSFPDRIHALQKRTYEHTGLNTDKPLTDEVWGQMAESARLSPLQRETIIKLRDLYLRNVGILARRRQRLTSVLQTALPMSNDQCGGVTDNKYSCTLGTMDELRDTLRDEHSCLMQFVLTIWRRVFTPAQAAHMNIAAYPSNADVLRVAEVLARAAGHPYSCTVMKQGAMEEGAQLVPVDAALPDSMRAWTAPAVDLAALYPGLAHAEAGGLIALPAAPSSPRNGSPVAAHTNGI
jgi:hypothetical protein